MNKDKDLLKEINNESIITYTNASGDCMLIPIQTADNCLNTIVNEKEQQLTELKAENERLINSFDELNSKYRSEMDKCISLQQQLKEKDDLISRLRQEHKDEMHQLYVNLDFIAKHEERKQICEKIRKESPYCHINGEDYYKVYIELLAQIEKGEDNA